MQVLLEADGARHSCQRRQFDTARQILPNRSNGLGVSDVVFQVAGSNRILAGIPRYDEYRRSATQGTGLLDSLFGDEF